MDHSGRSVKDLLLLGEGEQLDYKQSISNAQKISKILSAFANTKGGILVIGIRDNKTPSRIDVDQEMHMLDMAAGFYCKPPISVNYRTELYQGFRILIAAVEESDTKPHFAKGEDGKWWAYIRVYDQCLLASKVMLDVMKSSRDRHGASITFGKAEKILLQYLEKNARVSLKEFCKLANIGRWRAQKILVNLVRMNVVKVISTEKTDFYTL